MNTLMMSRTILLVHVNKPKDPYTRNRVCATIRYGKNNYVHSMLDREAY